jgi:hypothetical protein
MTNFNRFFRIELCIQDDTNSIFTDLTSIDYPKTIVRKGDVFGRISPQVSKTNSFEYKFYDNSEGILQPLNDLAEFIQKHKNLLHCFSLKKNVDLFVMLWISPDDSSLLLELDIGIIELLMHINCRIIIDVY